MKNILNEPILKADSINYEMLINAMSTAYVNYIINDFKGGAAQFDTIRLVKNSTDVRVTIKIERIT